MFDRWIHLEVFVGESNQDVSLSNATIASPQNDSRESGNDNNEEERHEQEIMCQPKVAPVATTEQRSAGTGIFFGCCTIVVIHFSS